MLRDEGCGLVTLILGILGIAFVLGTVVILAITGVNNAVSASHRAEADAVNAQRRLVAEEAQAELSMYEAQKTAFQERLIMLVTVMQGMDDKEVDRLIELAEGKNDRLVFLLCGMALSGGILVISYLVGRIVFHKAH